MKKIALVVGATLAICGTAWAVASPYRTGTYQGSTHQGQPIAMKVGRGVMKGIAYQGNYRCTDQVNGKQYTLKNVQNQYGSAPINSQQQVHEIYHTNNGQNVVKLFVQLNHGNAGGWFKQAFITHHHGHKLECVTPGGQATAAGKVFFSMHVQ